MRKIEKHRQQILDIAARHGAHDVRVIGSVARGEDNDASDIDLPVTFDQGRSLFDHGALISDLEDLLGVKVDVLSDGGLQPRFRERVFREAVAL